MNSLLFQSDMVVVSPQLSLYLLHHNNCLIRFRHRYSLPSKLVLMAYQTYPKLILSIFVSATTAINLSPASSLTQRST